MAGDGYDYDASLLNKYFFDLAATLLDIKIEVNVTLARAPVNVKGGLN